MRDVNIYRINLNDEEPKVEILKGIVRYNGENSCYELVYSVGPNDYVVFKSHFTVSDLGRVHWYSEGFDLSIEYIVLISEGDDRKGDIKKIREFCFRHHSDIMAQGEKILRGIRACSNSIVALSKE